jgi:hypothetical protein
MLTRFEAFAKWGGGSQQDCKNNKEDNRYRLCSREELATAKPGCLTPQRRPARLWGLKPISGAGWCAPALRPVVVYPREPSTRPGSRSDISPAAKLPLEWPTQ